MSCLVSSSKIPRALSSCFSCHLVFICGAGVSDLRGNGIVKALLLLLTYSCSGIKLLQFMIWKVALRTTKETRWVGYIKNIIAETKNIILANNMVLWVTEIVLAADCALPVALVAFNQLMSSVIFSFPACANAE